MVEPMTQVRCSAIAACVTTMNRPDMLEACLRYLSQCDPAPRSIVVSDDSADPAMIARNRMLVAACPNAIYITGPRRGVCANRNNALMYGTAQGADYVFFVDDDLHVPATFFGTAEDFYRSLPAAQRETTICTGYRDDCAGGPVRLTFRGYFAPAREPGSVTVSAAVFPIGFFGNQSWDENIFFGCEDAELSLRAMATGYRLHFHPTLMSYHLADRRGVLVEAKADGMSRYEVCREAARLYVGAKRYAIIEPNPLKLGAFLAVYFAHLTFYLARRQSLRSFAEILRISNVKCLWRMKRVAGVQP